VLIGAHVSVLRVPAQQRQRVLQMSLDLHLAQPVRAAISARVIPCT
jgi:hypothetical protein